MRLHLGFSRVEWDTLSWIDQRMYQEQLDAHLEATAPSAQQPTQQAPTPSGVEWSPPTADQRLTAAGFRIERQG